MANKRIKNKQQKKQQTQTLKRGGYTEKEVKRLDTTTRKTEVKRITKNEKAKALRHERREQLLKNNIPLSIITRERLDYKAIDFDNKKQLSRWRRQGENLDALKAAGYKLKDVPKSHLNYGWGKLQENYPKIDVPYQQQKRIRKTEVRDINKVYTANEYLYIGFADVVDGWHSQNLSVLPINDLKTLIMDRVREARMNEDDSSSFRGVFHIAMGSKESMEHRAQVYYKRGYDMTPAHMKLVESQFSKVTVSNKWSEWDFLSMTYTCITQMKNDDVGHFVTQLKRYCKRNKLPFMDDLEQY